MSCAGCDKPKPEAASDSTGDTPCDGFDGKPMAAYRPTGQPDIACGVTSAPRPIPTLTRCLTSVCANDILPTVFAEPGTCFAGVEKWVRRVPRNQRLGVFYNWSKMTETLLLKNTPYVMTLQDDSELSPVALQMARRFMEDWPDDCCMLSLYTPPSYETESGFSRVDHKNSKYGVLMGAVAWLFKRETLICVRNTQSVCGTPKALAMEAHCEGIALSEGRTNDIIAGWRGCHNKELVDRLDIALGYGLVECKLAEYVHTPSLCQHVADTSTLPGHPPAWMTGVHAESVLMEVP